MKIITPLLVDDANLVSSDVTDTDYTLWVAGTYNTGDQVRYNASAWEALRDGVTSEPSADVPLDWLRLGYINKWRMFRDGRDSKTEQLEEINVVFTSENNVTSLGVIGLEGLEIELTVTDAVEGIIYNETRSLVDISAGNWWEFFFLPYEGREDVVFSDIPPYNNADYAIRITGANASSLVKAGRVIAGIARDLGVTNYGTSVGAIDYSTKERDSFGNLTLVARRSIKLVNFDVTVETGQVGRVQSILSKLSTVPTLYIGDESFESTIVFGVYRDFTEVISSPSLSDMNIEVEGF